MGRPKGSGNRPFKRVLADHMAKKFGAQWNPVVEMANGAIKLQEIAEQSGETADYKASVEAMEKVSNFLVPKLRAIEHSTGDQDGLVISVNRKRYDGGTNEPEEVQTAKRLKVPPPSEGERYVYIYVPPKKKL